MTGTMSDEMQEIWALYADDGAGALDAMETALEALGGGREDGEAVAALFRAVHTFKGNARVLGLSVVESRAHLAEDLIGLVRDHGVALDAEILDLLMLTADTLRAMLEDTAASRTDAEPAPSAGLMAALKDKIARCSGAAPEPAVEAEPVAVTAGEAAPMPPVNPNRRSDPVYLEIFAGMARETASALRGRMAGLADDPSTAAAVRAEAEGLLHAAAQMGFADWAALMHGLASGPIDAETVAATLLRIDDLMPSIQPVPPAAEAAGGDGMRDFFTALSEPLASVADIARALEGQDTPPPATADIARRITALAEPLGFVRVADAAGQLGAARSRPEFRAAKLRLYEELASIEEAASDGTGVQPKRLLQSWCADTVFDDLDQLSGILEEMRAGARTDGTYARFNRSMRPIYHACKHYGIDSAAQLSMSLVDLFARMQTASGGADPVLLRIAGSFIDTMELVFDALDHGDPPDTAAIDHLLEDAANACFSGNGPTASSVERRLGLPRSFHRVLSPDSVKSATAAIEAGLRFYVIRSDLNADDALAEAFVAWLATDEARMITNVTVFQGDRTLFDFLIASRLDDARLAERLTGLCPDPEKLAIELSLGAPGPEPSGPGTPGGEEPGQILPTQSLSTGFLSAMGELSAGHATVHHLLETLASADPMAEIESAARAQGVPLGALRTILRGVLDRRAAQVQAAHEAATQLNAQLVLLQEEATALRSRGAESMLRALAVFAETTARQAGGSLRVSHAGGDLMLDHGLLEGLRGLLRAILAGRAVTMQGRAGHLRISLEKAEEMLHVQLTDDLPAPPDLAPLEAQAAALGAILTLERGSGGMDLTLDVPLPLVMLEGMVVGVGDIRYVVPVDSIRRILQSDASRVLTVSAQGGGRMLRLEHDEVVPIHPLHRGEAPAASDDAGGHNVFLILGQGERAGGSLALPVDELVGRQLVQLRPLRGVLARNRALSGVAILGAGEVGMVVSVRRLLAG